MDIVNTLGKVRGYCEQRFEPPGLMANHYGSVHAKTEQRLRWHSILNLNYYSRINERFIKIYGKNFTLRGDLISNKVEIYNQKKVIKKFKLEKNFTYIQENKFLLKKKFKIFCSLNEGKYIMKIIDNIKNS